jgi:hypothetical protein
MNDCFNQTSCASGCPDFLLGNDRCNQACLTLECGYLFLKIPLNGFICYYPSWDGGDCNCAQDCTPNLVGDGNCDPDCNYASCDWDGKDCYCAIGCDPTLIDNGVCNVACNVADCGYDGSDCNCAAGCNGLMYVIATRNENITIFHIGSEIQLAIQNATTWSAVGMKEIVFATAINA